MHFGITCQYTPQALQAMAANPQAADRWAAVKKLAEAGGGKLVGMWADPSNGPGVWIIIDVPDADSAMAMSALAVAGGAVQNLKMTRLLTQDELTAVRAKRGALAKAYSPPV